MSKNHPEEEIRGWSKFILKRIVEGYRTQGRSVLPCSSEIDCVLEKKKIRATIHFFTGGFITINFENYETIEDILVQVCEKLGIHESYRRYYGIYEVNNKQLQREECFVENFVKMGDVIASWSHEKSFLKKRTIAVEEEEGPRLYLKLRYFYELDIEKSSDLHILYNEACFYFKQCHCPMD